ncbi:MAG: hypothetical protein WBN71_02870 [Acidimicrobiia bacterium]
MRRTAILLIAGCLLFLGCTGSTDDSTTVPSSTTSTEVTTATTSTTTSTTLGSSTTSAPTSTTTVPSPTTAPPTTGAIRPVTVHPNLPAAVGGHLVDWDAVGPGWILALYDASDIATAVTHPTVLYVIDPAGTLYEVASWASGPYEIADWSGTGDAAILLTNGSDAVIVDLRTGTEVATMALPLGPYGPPVSFTEPTGTNVVVLTDDGTTQRVERRNRSGSVLAILGEQPAPTDARDGLEWLYGDDGTFALIKHAGGIELVSNDGSFVRDLWTPMAHLCTPKRWWSSGSFVAACVGEGPAFPHDWYHQVWILNTDGTAGVPLTEIPAGVVPVVDMGYFDAWQIPSHTYAQWIGDCGAAHIGTVAPDGSVTAIGGAENRRLVSVDGSQITALGSLQCDSSEARLFSTDLSGVETGVLIPRIGDAWGVRSAATLTTVYP